MRTLKEKLIIGIIMPIVDKVVHTNISMWYNRIFKMSQWTPSQIQQWQDDRLNELVNHAYNNTIYYRELFDSIGLLPSDIKTKEDLKKVPPLTKEIIRNRFNDIVPTNISSYNYHYGHTGGSTGDPTQYIIDNNSWGFINSFDIHMWKKTGYRYGDKFMALGSSSIFPTNKRSIKHILYYALKGKVPFNTMNSSDEVLQQCVDYLSLHKIEYIYGYPSSIFLLAKYIEDHSLGALINIKACFPTSEVLTDKYKETIARALNCNIMDDYGAYDGGICACDNGNGFYVGYNCLVNLLNEDDSNLGPALLTDITNFAFPFIQYQLGDVLEIDNQKSYSELFNGQVLKNVIGRTSDIIYLENGRVLTGPGFTVLFGNLNIIGYKIAKTGVLEITIEVLKGKGYTEEEERLINDTIKKYAGEECVVIIKYVSEFKKNKNGKASYFIN